MHHFKVKIPQFPGGSPPKWHGRAPKMHRFKVKFSKFPGDGPPDPPPTPSRWYGRAPKIHHFKVFFFKISWGLPPRPPQNGMAEHPKCTMHYVKMQTPSQTYPTPAPCPSAMHSANTLFAPRKSRYAPSIFNLDNLVISRWTMLTHTYTIGY